MIILPYLAACMYKSDIGVPKSFCKPKGLFTCAADAGEKNARNAMAFMEPLLKMSKSAGG